MSAWRHLTRGLRALVTPRSAERDIADEVQHYLDETVASLEAQGLSPDEARRTARLEAGSPTALREEVRSYGWENLPGTLLADLRYAVRRLRSAPGFAAVSILTLALGIGATTAIFSAVNPILFEPLPYPHAGRIMMIWDVGADGGRDDVTFGTYREVAERSRSFDALAAMRTWQPTMTGPAEPERLDGQRVGAEYFRVLGVTPVLGRSFDASDDQLNGPRVAIIGDGLWHRRFGGDRTIVGRQVTLDGDPYTIIGVMPAGFENVVAPSAEIWRPLQYDASLPPDGREWGHHLRLAGRLRAGVGADDAVRDVGRIARTPVAEFARPRWASLERGLVLNSLQDDVTRGVKAALLAVLGAVVLVLAIACVNVTNLLLARGARRRGEFAMRAALGAGRSRLIGQLLTESVLLAVLGGVLGMAVAELGIRVLVALSPAGLPRAGAIGMDGSVLAFAFGVTALIGLAVGLIPALHASRTDLHAGLQAGSRQTAGGHQATRRVLVVAEVALALVLLVSAGLLLRSLQRLFAVDAGFEPAHLLTMQIQVSGHRFDDDEPVHAFYDQALEAVRRVPGVTAAALTSQLPLTGDYDVYGVQFESSPDESPREGTGAFRYAVSPGFLQTIGIPLRRGRLLDEHDVGGGPLAVLINESFARRRLPGRDPIGEHVRVGANEGPWGTVVGVVADVKQTSLALSPDDAVYLTTAQWRFADGAMWLVVRGRGDAAALVPAIRAAIWSVDKDQPIVRVGMMDALVAASASERRFALIVFEAFGLAALLLAATGIYGVLSGTVAERMREIGVRAALGASRGNIVALVLKQGMGLAALGVIIGAIGAIAASRTMVTLLFGVSRLDPLTYCGVILLLLGVSAIACGVPAWRAAWVDPASTLRTD